MLLLRRRTPLLACAGSARLLARLGFRSRFRLRFRSWLRLRSGFWLRPRFRCGPRRRSWSGLRGGTRLRWTLRRRSRLLFEIEAVGHIVRLGVTGVERRQTEGGLAEFYEAHMRMEGLGNVAPLGIGTKHQATDAWSVAELGVLVGSWPAVGRPLLDILWLDVIVPATPVVPGDEDDGLRPQAALDDCIHLIHCPLHARADHGTSSAAMRWMLAETFRVEP